MTDRPVLMFDSGIGGLTVLREARVLMPDRRFVYVADDAAFPYGAWEEPALKAHILDLFGTLLDRFRPEISVIACNTASTLVIEALRQRFPGHPFVGTVPAIKPAAERTRSGVVSVLATPGTVKRQYTRDLIRQWASRCHVRLVGSDRLAGLAEAYMRDRFVDEEAIRAEIAPCFVDLDGRRTDIVVLACTHYPFLVNRMRKTAPWPVDWLDPAEAIARRALSLLSDPARDGGSEPPPLTPPHKGEGDAVTALSPAIAEVLEPGFPSPLWGGGRGGGRSISDNPARDSERADIALFTSGRDDPATRRLMHGFGLAILSSAS